MLQIKEKGIYLLMKKDRTIHTVVTEMYKEIVEEKYGEKCSSWPIVSGSDIINGEYGEYIIGVFKHSGSSVSVTSEVATFTSLSTGVDFVNSENRELVRIKIRNFYHLGKFDYIIIAKKDGSDLIQELNRMLEYHEIVTGEKKVKIFLSHKGEDKDLVRDYKLVLIELGFDVWLDEDAMTAGVPLHRSIQKGFSESCAVVFFITEKFIDENFLEMEINYAVHEKFEKKDLFSIITLVLSENSVIPDLLKTYVWKTPKTDLEGLKEILRALPLQVGPATYR